MLNTYYTGTIIVINTYNKICLGSAILKGFAPPRHSIPSPMILKLSDHSDQRSVPIL